MSAVEKVCRFFEEANHAGFYATLNAKYPFDFWKFAKGVQKAEENGDAKISGIASKVRDLGHEEAAEIIEEFAKQEANHGVIIKKLFEQYNKN